MTIGSAAPLWFPDFLIQVADALVIGAPPSVPPVAYDGLRARDGAPTATSTGAYGFSGNTITGTNDFVSDGWLPGMTVDVSNSASNDGAWAVVANVEADTLTLTDNVTFVAESAGPTVDLSGASASGFAVFIGSRNLNVWTGPNAAHIVPAFGIPEDAPRMFRTASIADTPAKPLEAMYLGVDVYVWGAEPGPDVPRDSYRWDAECIRSACEILQNIVRVLSVLSGAFGVMNDAQGWVNETEATRHGEAFVFSWRCSFVVSDFPDPSLESPIAFDATGQPSIVRPGE